MFPAAGLVAALLVIGFGGCRGKAHNDLYRQKMASEIRVLEDQLYAADYENRVLRDKLERERQRKTSGRAESSDRPDSGEREPSLVPRPAPPVEPELVPAPLDPIQRGRPPAIESLPEMDELELPDVNPGVPTPMIEPPASLDAPPDVETLPAPGGPEPPGKEDIDPSGVIPGEVLPPPASPENEKPPGQIKLPDAVQAGNGVPSGLRVHRSLSGGYRFENEEVDGLMVVVNVVDPLGQTVDVVDFDIDGELSIVVLDPEREPDEARLGRWDFKGPQIGSLIRSEPISGLHVPLRWKDGKQPSGKQVIVHVRLRGEEDEMRCEQTISVEGKSAVAQWSPRGESFQPPSRR